ncbi:MAG: GNAT family N-acetyltransferase [Actinobacteria bacterium]|nr:GNAT family N-acetyltransferase [Actinomycetota bacterium]MBO0818867.1 GNAT family N-acetyltransferase [Actinomycetota bacterium]
MRYTSSLAGVTPEHLAGFFHGWPAPPSPQRQLEILRGSSEVVLARDEDGTVTGFITALTDGLLAAYIPLLEVRPGWRGQGIGSELVRRMLARLAGCYMIDLVCDRDLLPFYARLGLRPYTAAIIRDHAALRALSGRE